MRVTVQATVTVLALTCGEMVAMSIIEQLEAAGEVLSPAQRTALVAHVTENERIKARVREL